jgi:hypothetical protein
VTILQDKFRESDKAVESGLIFFMFEISSSDYTGRRWPTCLHVIVYWDSTKRRSLLPTRFLQNVVSSAALLTQAPPLSGIDKNGECDASKDSG